MTWKQIEADWQTYKRRVKQQWVELTDDDLALIDGRREQLADRIQSRYGYARNEAEREIDWFCQNCSACC